MDGVRSWDLIGLDGVPQQRARNRCCAGKEAQLDADRREIAFDALALGGAFPVVALEQDIEAQLLLDREDIVLEVRISRVDELDATEDFEPVGDRDDGDDTFDALRDLVADDACDQDIAMPACITQQIEMPDMKEIERAGGITDAVHLRLLFTPGTQATLVWSFRSQLRSVPAFQFEKVSAVEKGARSCVPLLAE
jgi:hypothetical protein